VKLLADTHVLLWAALEPAKLSDEAQDLLNDPANQVFFSTASIWETAIKFGRNRNDFPIDPAVLRVSLLRAGYQELPITSEHAIAVGNLHKIHRDPFDRLLVAQANVEGILLVTKDATLARYPGVRKL
jgi:PIN domain nuclease of toxin-antitoxin system